MAGRALVLGGGGITGIAWELGVLAGLAEHGVELRDADLIVGTSAGSVVGALIASGTELAELYASQLAPPEPHRPVRMRMAMMVWWGLATVCSRDAERMGARVGKMALAATTVPEAERRRIIEARLGTHIWPPSPSAGDGGLTAGCARRPTPTSPRDMSGSWCSRRSRAVYAGLERPPRQPHCADRRQGIRPQGNRRRSRSSRRMATARAAIGHNVLDLAHRAPAAVAGRRQAGALAAEVARVWSG